MKKEFNPAVKSLLLVCLFLIASVTSQATAIRLLPDLVSITFYEKTGISYPAHPHTIAINHSKLTTQLADPLYAFNKDFKGTQSEFYDVFYSDADGTFNIDGEYITIEGIYRFELPNGGGLNIAEVQLNFADGRTEFANAVASFQHYGDNAVLGTEQYAADSDLDTWTLMGNTNTVNDRMHITLGFQATSGCLSHHCGNNKVLMCHIPPGNTSNAHEICISPSAMPAHLAHGDYCGPCGVNARNQSIHSVGDHHSHDISLFPNPFTNTFNVSLAEGVLNHHDKVAIDIYDLYGRLIKTISVTSSQVSIDLSELSRGMYICLIQGDQGIIHTERIQKE